MSNDVPGRARQRNNSIMKRCNVSSDLQLAAELLHQGVAMEHHSCANLRMHKKGTGTVMGTGAGAGQPCMHSQHAPLCYNTCTLTYWSESLQKPLDNVFMALSQCHKVKLLMPKHS